MEVNFCVYLLFSEKTNKYYIGKTNNINRRFMEHALGEETYTRTGRPWKLMSTINCPNGSEAAKLENKLKKSRNKKYVKWYFETHGNKMSVSTG